MCRLDPGSIPGIGRFAFAFEVCFLAMSTYIEVWQ